MPGSAAFRGATCERPELSFVVVRWMAFLTSKDFVLSALTTKLFV
jgi:hypothetical protein